MTNKLGKSLFKTQEIQSVNSNILYYQNSYSSIAYFLVALYLLFNSEYTLVNHYIIFLLVNISIVSYLWWAKQNKIIHILDIILYSSLIFTIGLYISVKNTEITSNQFICYNLLFIFTIILLIYININIIKLVNLLSGVFSLISLYYNKNITVLIIFVSSVLFKLLDSSRFKIPLLSGTVWFHILSAIGYLNMVK